MEKIQITYGVKVTSRLDPYALIKPFRKNFPNITEAKEWAKRITDTGAYGNVEIYRIETKITKLEGE